MGYNTFSPYWCLLLVVLNLVTRLSSAPSQKCSYTFTVDSGEAVAMCGLSDSRSAPGYHSDLYNTATVDDSTAMKLLSAVTQLLEHQNIMTEVKVASQSIQELKAELLSQQSKQLDLLDTIGGLKSSMQLVIAGQKAKHVDTPFREFTGKTSRYLGCPARHPERIHELAPIRNRFEHILKIIPRSCLEWRQRGYRQKGLYVIDPDGLEGEPPFEVECIMTADEPAMVLNHDQPRRHHVVGFEDPGSYIVNITYSKASARQLETLIAVSYRCEQYLSWECKGASLSRETWWQDRHGHKVEYWGGGGPVRGCACYRNSSCFGNNLCNCDANDDNRWLLDHGYLDDKHRLPVSRMLFGDTGSYNEEGYVTLGPLQCYSNASNPYSTTTAFLPVEVWPPFLVFCDYDGWIVIQHNHRDFNGSFDKTWQQYTTGFGDFHENFWLGLDKLYQLTNQNVSYDLHVSFETENSIKYYAEYDQFRVGAPEEKYRLHIREHRGTASDELGPYKGMPFTTFDEDNDRDVTTNCAQDNSGGFWFNLCDGVVVNGESLQWGDVANLIGVEMRIRPQPDV